MRFTMSLLAWNACVCSCISLHLSLHPFMTLKKKVLELSDTPIEGLQKHGERKFVVGFRTNEMPPKVRQKTFGGI